MIRLAVRAHPGARFERVAVRPDGTLEISVCAPASEGRANEALLRALATATGLRRRQIRLIRGERSRLKLVELELPSSDELRCRLEACFKSEGRE